MIQSRPISRICLGAVQAATSRPSSYTKAVDVGEDAIHLSWASVSSHSHQTPAKAGPPSPPRRREADAKLTFHAAGHDVTAGGSRRRAPDRSAWWRTFAGLAANFAAVPAGGLRGPACARAVERRLGSHGQVLVGVGRPPPSGALTQAPGTRRPLSRELAVRRQLVRMRRDAVLTQTWRISSGPRSMHTASCHRTWTC